MDEAEHSREHIESQLREIEERFRQAQVASGIGWFEWDLATNEWQWTPYVAVLFGFDRETAKPSFADWERAIFVDDVPKLHAAVERATESGAYYTEFRVRHPDGSVHWIAGKGEAPKDGDGRSRVSGVYYEISERKALEARLLALNETLETRVAELREEARTRRRAEEELQRINETLEERVGEEVKNRQQVEDALRQAQKMEAIGQLTGGVAHDFNNLLTVIMGNLETMQRRFSPDHEFQRLIAAGLRAAFRGAELTQRLLVFARRQPLAPEVISPNRLVGGMSDLLRRALGEAVAIETVLAGGLWNIFADANQLENALINLAVNGRDAMPDGGRLTIEAANCYLDDAYCSMHGELRPGQYVGMFVTDTGSGMPDEVVEKVFEPFFTTKTTGQGTGLGLSQVYGFVKESGGHVKIYSEIGQGTCVKLYLPRHLGAAALVEPASEPLVPPRAHRDETVLVVEDDPDVRNYTVDMVTDLGYQVLSAPDGSTALRLLDAHPELRLLFTDVVLPGGMNGRQLADRALRRRPGIKVLYTTGYARNAIVHHGRLDPGVEVVFKPFTYSDLAAKIRKAIDS